MKRTGTAKSPPTAVPLYWSRPAADVLAELGHVAEGVTSCESILALASSYDVEMPLTDAVHRVCHKGLSVDQAVVLLLGRSTKPE